MGCVPKISSFCDSREGGNPTFYELLLWPSWVPTFAAMTIQCQYIHTLARNSSMIIPWNAHGFGNALKLGRAFYDHALGQLFRGVAINFLPRRLRRWNFVAATLFQLNTAFGNFISRKQQVAIAVVEIDAHFVAVFQNGKAAACGGFG